jgi:hypothetical protein
MKKAVLFACLLAVSVLFIQSPARAQMTLGFKVTGGLGYYGAGDLNTGLQGWSDVFSYIYDAYSPTGGYEPVHLGMDFGGELLLQFNPQIALGLGVGFLQASRSSSLVLSYAGEDYPESWSPKISAVPITLSLHYFVPLSGKIKLSLDAGMGYYFGKCTDTQHIIFIIEFDRTYDTTASGVGFHGGLGLEIPVAPSVSIVFEARGRFAKLGGFKGTVESDSSTTTGDVWLADVNLGKNLTLIDIYGATPSGDNPRLAKLDFSGFSAAAGFVFRFGGR